MLFIVRPPIKVALYQGHATEVFRKIGVLLPGNDGLLGKFSFSRWEMEVRACFCWEWGTLTILPAIENSV